MVKAADMMIARRADTRARADFATWKMMAKLNGASALPEQAQSFLQRYNALLKEKSEAEATEIMIQLVYRSYYGEMGGVGEPPDVKTTPTGTSQAAGNVMAFKRPPPQKPKVIGGSQTRPRLPVALIFICLVVVYTAFRYFYR